MEMISPLIRHSDMTISENIHLVSAIMTQHDYYILKAHYSRSYMLQHLKIGRLIVCIKGPEM